ncbi:MAG: hypothetical protein KKD00_11810, partial [Gammaproteobacteria bacterium]|nr:hypothetical protein [Gammaproteobacteria bacterium]
MKIKPHAGAGMSARTRRLAALLAIGMGLSTQGHAQQEKRNACRFNFQECRCCLPNGLWGSYNTRE